jgi:hypothetical protein
LFASKLQKSRTEILIIRECGDHHCRRLPNRSIRISGKSGMRPVGPGLSILYATRSDLHCPLFP